MLRSVRQQLDGCDAEVCRAAAKAWHPPREKSGALKALQSGRDRLTLLFGSPFALPLRKLMTEDDKGSVDALSAGLGCALRLGSVVREGLFFQAFAFAI